MNLKVKQVVQMMLNNKDFTLKAAYSELVNTIQTMQMLNNDITIKAKVNKKVLSLGIFRIKQIIIDGDGESKLRFNGLSDYIEMDNLNMLPLNSDEVKEFVVMLTAEVEDVEE